MKKCKFIGDCDKNCLTVCYDSKLTIFNTYVEMESQEQCDRMKQLCLDNGLPIWESELDVNISFELFDISKYFKHNGKEFLVGNNIENKTAVTEQQFINLLKEYKQ